MYSRTKDVVLEVPFLFATAVLIFNDVVLKYVYPGVLSGKLSDFAGLYVVGCLATAMVRRRAVASALALIGAGFVWWKSPWSGPVIAQLDALGLSVGRTVDYTDLVALCILPVCTVRTRPMMPGARLGATALRCGSILIVAAAVAGTSYMPLRDEYTIRKTTHSEVLDRSSTEATIVCVLTAHGLRPCTHCERDPSGAVFLKGDLYVRYQFLESGTAVRFRVEGSPGFMIFRIGSSRREIASLQRQFRRELGSRIKDLEFVVDLSRAGS